jgi:N-acetylneuraminate synthase
MSSIQVIAEIGINHGGSRDVAKKLISESAAAGVDGIKFQYRNLDNAYSNSSREIGDELLLKEIKKNYLSPDVILELLEYSHENGLQVGISFFDTLDINDFENTIDRFDFFKLPSAELTNSDLIEKLMSYKKHLLISTGCHDENELEAAFSPLPNDGWTPLHCISNYPLTLQNAKLGYLSHMREKWQRNIGYSSHDSDWEICLLAMQAGATVIERHITLDKEGEGLDHSSSSTPEEFRKICLFAKNMDVIFAGCGRRVPNQGELLNRQNLGRSFFLNEELKAGDLLTENILDYRSPNTGINRKEIKQFLGQRVVAGVKAGEVISKSHFKVNDVLPDEVIDFSRKNKVALPVRLHDLDKLQNQFPIENFEFHLSFEEILSDIDFSSIRRANRFSVHLPDYISSTKLMDPFSADSEQKEASDIILERTIDFASQLQEVTGKKVPVVGSFSLVHDNLDRFYEDHASLIRKTEKREVTLMPQWLPPIAWYFGGSIRLDVFNQERDVEKIKHHNLAICMDICHLLLGKNLYNFSPRKLVDSLSSNIQHIHIADAIGIDGEGLAIGDGEPENMEIMKYATEFDCMKVIEVWQGHLDNGAGFRKALQAIYNLGMNIK